MRIIGIIAEYNPFHNGHAYQIEKIRSLTQADFVIAAMSGNFVQRGEPALIDKYARTEMALSCGADLVIELPALWATASAELSDQHIEVYIEKKKKADVNFDTVSCPECSGLISKDAAICPHCGVLFDEKIINIVNDNKKKLQKKNKKFSLKKFILDTLLILLFMVLTFLVVNLLINKSAENYNNVNGTNIVSKK